MLEQRTMNLAQAAEMLKVHPDTLAGMAREHADDDETPAWLIYTMIVVLLIIVAANVYTHAH